MKWVIGLVIIFFIILSIINPNINANDLIITSITALSIIFGFSFSAICSIYGNRNFNIVIKANRQLDCFLKDNTSLFYKLLGAIWIDFSLLLIHPHTYEIHIDSLSFYINIITYAVYGITSYIVYLSFKFIRDFMVIYKNSYSDYAKKIVDKNQQ
jgi:hypothetical protein